jgi:hypothetical protein
MTTTASSDLEIVTLKGGLVVSVEALRLALTLEDRGFRMEPVGDKLRVDPRENLTADDVTLIRQHRDELLAIVNYNADAHAGVQ